MASASAQEPPRTTALPARAVREGNQFLKGGNPAAALERYGEAKTAQPDAREIAFDEGLAHCELGEYDKAREAFDRAAGSERDELADDAIYSAGATDHKEAIDQAADPKAALGKLENAMQRYQSVLSRRPKHQHARDANYKAASYWRQLRQQLQQQEQQQQQQSESENQEEQQDQDQQQQEQPSAQDEQQKQQQQSVSGEQEQQDKQEQQQAEANEQQEQQEQQSQAQEAKEDVSREQAERKLREVMQAHRDRKKQRREEVRKTPLQPVEKDW
jgi:tetratricopeptide (TPR) repeat protein